MSAPAFAKLETVHHDEGVVATRSSTGLQVRLPALQSVDQQLRVIAVLWELWTAARAEDREKEMRWTVCVSDPDELTAPLIAILSTIDTELCRTGHGLLVIGGPAMPSHANGQT